MSRPETDLPIGNEGSRAPAQAVGLCPPHLDVFASFRPALGRMSQEQAYDAKLQRSGSVIRLVLQLSKLFFRFSRSILSILNDLRVNRYSKGSLTICDVFSFSIKNRIIISINARNDAEVGKHFYAIFVDRAVRVRRDSLKGVNNSTRIHSEKFLDADIADFRLIRIYMITKRANLSDRVVAAKANLILADNKNVF